MVFSLLPIMALIFFLPLNVFAGLYFSEIAWMGTTESQYGEWIELGNNGTSPVSLDGYTLYEKGGETPIISLDGTISADGFWLVERSTASNPDPIPNISGTIGSFGGSGLSNSGELLVLKDRDGVIVDSVDALTGWPAGDSKTKQTMQIVDGVWITATGTPGIKNFKPEISLNNIESNISANDLQQKDSGPVYFSVHSSGIEITQPDVINKSKIYLNMGANRIATINTPLLFEANIYDENGPKDVSIGRLEWSFGDGQSFYGNDAVHVFDHEGEYMVTASADTLNQKIASSLRIKVIKPDFDFRFSGKDLVVTNESDSTLNMGGFKVYSQGKTFVFPKETLIMSGKTIVLSQKIIGFSFKEGDILNLQYPNGQDHSSIKVINFSDKDSDENGKLDALKSSIEDLRSQVVGLTRVYNKSVENGGEFKIPSDPSLTPSVAESESSKFINDRIVSDTQPASIIISTQNREGLFSKMIKIPERTLLFIKNLIF